LCKGINTHYVHTLYMDTIALLGVFLGALAILTAYIPLRWYAQDRKRVYALAERSAAGMERIRALIPSTPEEVEALEARITPIVDRMVLHAADQVLQRVGPIVDERVDAAVKEVGGIVAGTLGALIEAKQQGLQYQTINAGREKGLETKKLHGFTNAAARTIAAELDPSGGVLAGKLLDIAEEYGVNPEEAIQLGLSIAEKYPGIAEKLAPAVGKAGKKLKEVAGNASHASHASQGSGGGWG